MNEQQAYFNEVSLNLNSFWQTLCSAPYIIGRDKNITDAS